VALAAAVKLAAAVGRVVAVGGTGEGVAGGVSVAVGAGLAVAGRGDTVAVLAAGVHVAADGVAVGPAVAQADSASPTAINHSRGARARKLVLRQTEWHGDGDGAVRRRPLGQTTTSLGRLAPQTPRRGVSTVLGPIRFSVPNHRACGAGDAPQRSLAQRLGQQHTNQPDDDPQV